MPNGDYKTRNDWFGTSIIVFSRPDAGYPFDIERAARYLEKDTFYTVKHIRVWDSTSDIELEEYPGIYFNCVHFTAKENKD